MYARRNDRNLKEKRRQLRKEMSRAEKILWSQLRGRQLDGLRFQRQYSIGVYILDFYCPALSLAIEADGFSHAPPDARLYDNRRTADLEAQGITVVRFWNEEIFERCDRVIERIREVAEVLRGESSG
jgi:very-short-patch-repair endonuclease